MGPKPEVHHAQVSRPVVALRNICRDYPAGWGILGELLQNADDAGASNIKFILDENNYSKHLLLHDDLAEFQGPALLAYNNSTFSDEDFISLSRIGDSKKAYDGSATGKFGRGFNSVYNWTDCPSILSRELLLILDPHHRWSHDFGVPGGPSWNFVKNSEALEMRNQMAMFSSLVQEYDQSFQGTVIRMPLRTVSQAETSEICQRQTTVPEMRDVLESFVSGFGHTGLLFVKNIEKISIVIGNEAPYFIEISNSDIVRRRKSEINKEICRALTDGERPFHLSFNIEINCGKLGATQKSKFAVHHMIGEYPHNDALRDWYRSETMIPWVAIAAETGSDRRNPPLGSLFNVLPLPISSYQPVHIHGAFSISPDRARLHQNDNSGAQDLRPSSWNEWLFKSLIPNAWVELLSYLAQEHPKISQFHIWPQTPDTHIGMSSGICQEVLQTICDGKHPLWFTEFGYSSLQDALLATGQESLELKSALQESGVPMIYVTDRLRSHVLGACQAETLHPKSLCQHLHIKNLAILSDDVKRELLAYVVSDPQFSAYGALKLFPFEDGVYRTLDGNAAFVHRNYNDRDLFSLESPLNIDNGKITDETLHTLQDRCTSSVHASLRFRHNQDLNAYCMTHVFEQHDTNLDVVYLEKESALFVSKIWDWIISRDYSISDDSIASLWLIPLSNGGYRRIRPKDPSSDTIYALPDELGRILWRFAGVVAVNNKPLLRASAVSSQVLQLLLGAARRDSTLALKDSDVLEDFVQWLASIPTVVNMALDSDKQRLLELIVARLNHSTNLATVSTALRCLEIFPRTIWKIDEMYTPNSNLVLQYDADTPRKSSSSWTAIQDNRTVVGLPENCPLPELSNIVFVDAWREPVTRLLQGLELAECPSIVDVIQNFIVPRWDQRMLNNVTSPYIKEMVERLLRHFHSLDRTCQNQIALLHIVPVMIVNSKAKTRFARAARLVDPLIQNLGDLFFEDEESHPDEWVISKYRGVLIDCGMKVGLDDELLEDRVRCFSSGRYPVKEVATRAAKLLRSTTTGLLSTWQRGPDSIVRQLQWLPATDQLGQLHLATADNCRAASDRLLVGYVLPVVDEEISVEWRERLGWNASINNSVLFQQLDHGIANRDIAVVNAVLTYITSDAQTIDYQLLLDRQCVWTSDGHFVYPRNVFRAGCERLVPYLANVDNSFWQSHQALLTRLEVKELPTFDDLLNVQQQLEAPLDEPDIAVIIETIRLASVFTNVAWSSLKIPSATGELCFIREIVLDDLGRRIATTNYNSTHPGIPIECIRKLGIEPLSERVIKGELGLADVDDEDEFDQREEVAAGIADTLERYPVEATFKEYLANADDANATQINWLLDGRSFAGESLVAAELSAFQGPALLVHNDATFEDRDFDGLKHVERGSKRDRSSAIGKFGRGSQTMYHWTDVPMILSGSYLVILDPLQQVLPMNYVKGHRKPGVKILLSKLRALHPDQIAPFEGLWNYSINLDFYQGTIFRFPLRPLGCQSRLRESTTPLNYDTARDHAETFFAEARISLLFLRNVHHVDFKVHGALHPRWSVDRSHRDAGSFSDWTTCKLARVRELESATCEDRWWVAIQDPINVPIEMQQRHKRTMKDVECGMAALVSSTSSNTAMITDDSPEPRVFSTLPLPFESKLPVHIHSTFLISGDRQSIPIEGSMRDAGSEWNRWLLGSAVPTLYLGFLEDLGRTIGQAVFSFWPQEVPPQGTIARLIDESFWQLLRSCSDRLFPLVGDDHVSKRRHIPRLVELNDATFDFLPESESHILAGLLESLIPTLVRVPGIIAGRIQSLEPDVTIVTGHMLRRLLSSEKGSECLQNEILKDTNVVEHLFNTILPAEECFQDLSGCHVLPLLDGKLGTLELKEASTTPRVYYVTRRAELQLFSFAPGQLLSSSVSKLHIQALLKDGRWNVERLNLSNVGNLLSGKDFLETSDTDVDVWIRDFWKFWHEKETANPVDVDIDVQARVIHDYPIFEATCNDVRRYMTLGDLDTLPSVVEPSIHEHQEICDRVAGLYRINSRYLPSSLKCAQDSFKDVKSFEKLIRALSQLAEEGRLELSEYVKNSLETIHLETLRKLVLEHIPIRSTKCSKDVKQVLECLPLWPVITPTGSLIAAKNAVIATDQRLFAPWVSINTQVITSAYSSQYEVVLQNLGARSIENIDIVKQHVLPNLPPDITEYRDDYKSLIAIVSQMCTATFSRKSKKNDQLRRELLRSLKGRAIAADGAGVLRAPSELFDCEDSLFLSAFRHEIDAKFLSQDIRRYREFWCQVGVRHRSGGVLDGADYLCCLHRLRQRLERLGTTPLDNHLDSDTLTILSPLTSMDNPLGTMAISTWDMVSSETVFPALSDLNAQPEYRRETMVSIALANPLLSLNGVVSKKYAPVCWSQVPFSKYEPTFSTLHKVLRKGCPSIETVWRHLEYLRSCVEGLKRGEVVSYLNDVYSTYDYFQQHLNDSKEGFLFNGCPLWLNLDITKPELVSITDLKSSWLPIEHLILSSSCDSPPLMSVRAGLMPYEKLLKFLGCQAIVHPTITLRTSCLVSSMAESICRLRNNGEMLDITLCADGGDVLAHKLVLAGASGYFQTMLNGRWNVGDKVVLEDMTHRTVSLLVEFAYQDQFDWSDLQVQEDEDVDRIADVLDDLLDLLAGADRWDMPRWRSQVEQQIIHAGRQFIRVDNVRDIQLCASRANAPDLETLCSQFYERNRVVVNLAYQSGHDFVPS